MSDALHDASHNEAASTPATQWAQWDLSAVVIPLLRGVVYRDEDATLWAALQALRARVSDYVAVLALELVVDEAEGYAFVRSRAQEDDEAAARLPRLVRRQPLTFHVSLLLALLRKKLAELDAGRPQALCSRGAGYFRRRPLHVRHRLAGLPCCRKL
jgi:hypothetical protein